MPEHKTETIGFRLNKEVKQALEQLAAAERRTLSSVIENVLYAELKRGGYIKSGEEKDGR